MRGDQFEAVTEWQRETFGKATALSKLHHLKEEVEELISDIENGREEKRFEFADCFILLFGAASSDGMSYDDCCDCIDDKFDILKDREWGNPDENGVVKHVKK
jgi:hypothetical protein